MNKFLNTARLTADPEVRYGNDNKPVVRFNIAVKRRFHRDGEPDADFFSCVAFGKNAETLEKCNVGKGTKLLLDCEVRNNNYTDREGVKYYGTQLIVNSFEFCESKASGNVSTGNTGNSQPYTGNDGFMNMDNFPDDELPF